MIGSAPVRDDCGYLVLHPFRACRARGKSERSGRLSSLRSRIKQKECMMLRCT